MSAYGKTIVGILVSIAMTGSLELFAIQITTGAVIQSTVRTGIHRSAHLSAINAAPQPDSITDRRGNLNLGEAQYFWQVQAPLRHSQSFRFRYESAMPESEGDDSHGIRADLSFLWDFSYADLRTMLAVRFPEDSYPEPVLTLLSPYFVIGTVQPQAWWSLLANPSAVSVLGLLSETSLSPAVSVEAPVDAGPADSGDPLSFISGAWWKNMLGTGYDQGRHWGLLLAVPGVAQAWLWQTVSGARSSWIHWGGGIIRDIALGTDVGLSVAALAHRSEFGYQPLVFKQSDDVWRFDGPPSHAGRMSHVQTGAGLVFTGGSLGILAQISLPDALAPGLGGIAYLGVAIPRKDGARLLALDFRAHYHPSEWLDPYGEPIADIYRVSYTARFRPIRWISAQFDGGIGRLRANGQWNTAQEMILTFGNARNFVRGSMGLKTQGGASPDWQAVAAVRVFAGRGMRGLTVGADLTALFPGDKSGFGNGGEADLAEYRIGMLAKIVHPSFSFGIEGSLLAAETWWSDPADNGEQVLIRAALTIDSVFALSGSSELVRIHFRAGLKDGTTANDLIFSGADIATGLARLTDARWEIGLEEKNR